MLVLVIVIWIYCVIVSGSVVIMGLDLNSLLQSLYSACCTWPAYSEHWRCNYDNCDMLYRFAYHLLACCRFVLLRSGCVMEMMTAVMNLMRQSQYVIPSSVIPNDGFVVTTTSVLLVGVSVTRLMTAVTDLMKTITISVRNCGTFLFIAVWIRENVVSFHYFEP